MNPIVADTLAAIITQTELDERFHADLGKALAAVFAAGAATVPAPGVAPQTAAEITAFRGFAAAPVAAAQ
jgi:hypothetical protein